MQFGSLSIGPGAALAPMAGFTDTACRAMAARHGAAYTVSEMVSAKALTFGDKKSARLIAGGGGEAPVRRAGTRHPETAAPEPFCGFRSVRCRISGGKDSVSTPYLFFRWGQFCVQHDAQPRLRPRNSRHSRLATAAATAIPIPQTTTSCHSMPQNSSAA